MEEIESEREDVYGRELVRSGRYMQQLEYEGRGLRRRAVDYEDLSDETESVVGGGDYDLYNHGDSTVAYAVQLAMRDKEDQLVEKALERIRRAQMLGKKNVRLSQRELDALERKRQQTDSSNAARRNKGNAGSAANSRPTSRRNGHTVPQEQPGPTRLLPQTLVEIEPPVLAAGLRAPHLRIAREPRPRSRFVRSSLVHRFDRPIPRILTVSLLLAVRSRCSSQCTHGPCRMNLNGRRRTIIPCR